MPSILFVCTANQCRSPMAEAIFERRLEEAGMEEGWQVDSAATWGEAGHPVTEMTLQAGAMGGVDLRTHLSQEVTGELLEDFGLVLVMESGHKEALRAEFPESAEKVHLLTEMAGEPYDVGDPTGEDIVAHRRTFNELENLIDRGMGRILREAGGEGKGGKTGSR